MKKLLCSAVIFTAFTVGQVFGQGVQVDSNLKDYTPVAGVAGTIKSVGSDTMNNMMTLWSEGFLKYYPSVRVEIEGKGSSTAPPALISGTSTFGPMSRKMKDAEVDAFEKQYGYKPTQVGTSIDMLAVYVNKDNPVKGMSLAHVDAIFSSTRKLGLDEINNWDQVGVKDLGAISLYGRNSASGTYGYFKKNVLGEGDYRATVKEQPGSASVVQGVASDKAGIGYSGIGYKTADVRAVPLASEEGGEAVPATAEFAYSGDYPLARFLWLSVNYKPGSQLDPLRREFMKYIFSRQGQEAVVKDGYFPVNAKVANGALNAVGIK